MPRECDSLEPEPEAWGGGREVTAVWIDETSSIEFVGDVGRDPLIGLEDPRGEWSTFVND